MNYSTAIFLINPKVRAIQAIYEPDTDQRKYPRCTFKTFDQSIQVGDYILVPTETRHKMTVNKVVEIDVEPDLETPQQINWVIGTVDRSMYEEVLASEAKEIELMKAAEKTHAREELRKKMMAHVDETKLAALQIARMSGDGVEAIEPPKA